MNRDVHNFVIISFLSCFTKTICVLNPNYHDRGHVEPSVAYLYLAYIASFRLCTGTSEANIVALKLFTVVWHSGTKKSLFDCNIDTLKKSHLIYYLQNPTNFILTNKITIWNIRGILSMLIISRDYNVSNLFFSNHCKTLSSGAWRSTNYFYRNSSIVIFYKRPLFTLMITLCARVLEFHVTFNCFLDLYEIKSGPLIT